MDNDIKEVFEKYRISGGYPESLLRAVQKTRNKIHNTKLYESKTEEYIRELDIELHKWVKKFKAIIRTGRINTDDFIRLFSHMFSLLKIDKLTIFNAGNNFKAQSTSEGYRQFSKMTLGEQFFHIMKPRGVIHARGNGSTCRYWAMFLMTFFLEITEETSGKSRIIGLQGSRHVLNALKIGDTWCMIDVMEKPCIVTIEDPHALKMIDPNLRVLQRRDEVLDGTVEDERINVFETIEDFIASTDQ